MAPTKGMPQMIAIRAHFCAADSKSDRTSITVATTFNRPAVPTATTTRTAAVLLFTRIDSSARQALGSLCRAVRPPQFLETPRPSTHAPHPRADPPASPPPSASPVDPSWPVRAGRSAEPRRQARRLGAPVSASPSRRPRLPYASELRPIPLFWRARRRKPQGKAAWVYRGECRNMTASSGSHRR